MRKFMIKVNGNSYEVEVEELNNETNISTVQQPKPMQTSVSAPAVKPITSGNEIKVAAPLPGTVIRLSVSNGAKVKKNDVIMVLEAMKMENEIRATADGTITFSVAQGAAVNSGDTIAYIA